MRRRGLLVITAGCVAAFGVVLSVMGTVAQLSEFRPIRANGTWQSDDGTTGTWSAELELVERLLSGDVVVVGHERFATGQVRATLRTSGDLENAELIFGAESQATVSGRLARDSLGGSFQIGSTESGEWSGDWRGVPPPGEDETPRQALQESSRTQDFRSHSSGIRSEVDIVLPNQTVETNQLASEPMDFGTFQVEVEVAVDRSGVSNRVALAAIDGLQFPSPHPGSPDLAYYISPDGGDTWPSSLKGVPPGIDDFVFGADPVIDYDRNGDLYYCAVVEKEEPGTDDQGIFVSRMPAQTNFFQNATLVRLVSSNVRTVDKPWCATGVTPGGSPQDIIYVTWVEYEVGPMVSTIKAAYSLNAGASFTGLTTISDVTPTDPKWPQVAVNPQTKTVNFVWLANATPATDDIKFDKCNFNGAGANLQCGTDVSVKTLVRPDTPLPGTFFRMSWFPYIAIGGSGSGNGWIYLIWTERSEVTPDTDIYFARSDGVSISFAFQKTIASAPLDEFFPAITADANHFARVVYLRRVSQQTDEFNVYSTYSGDAGSTWNGPTKVNDGPNIDPPFGEEFIGDYIGIDAKFERHAGWMDTRRAPPPTPSFDAYSAVMFGC